MKELTIQEKAERYNKAYKVAENIHKCSSNPAEIKRMEQIFPELKESEGEKIRKEIIDFIDTKTIDSDERRNKWFSYLEKQGESIDKITQRARTEKQRVILTETNGEANIDWDTRSIQDVKLLLEYGLDYIKKLENQGEQKSFDYENANIPQKDSTWSEEDKHWMQKVIDFMNHPDLIKATPTLAKDTINWLKSLKEIVQPQSKQEWSEEDESNFQGIIDVIKENKHHATDYEHMTYYKLLSWFKSLKERYVWKPSDEQIDALEHFFRLWLSHRI